MMILCKSEFHLHMEGFSLCFKVLEFWKSLGNDVKERLADRRMVSCIKPTLSILIGPMIRPINLSRLFVAERATFCSVLGLRKVYVPNSTCLPRKTLFNQKFQTPKMVPRSPHGQENCEHKTLVLCILCNLEARLCFAMSSTYINILSRYSKLLQKITYYM
jgi:hypothetical protein